MNFLDGDTGTPGFPLPGSSCVSAVFMWAQWIPTQRLSAESSGALSYVLFKVLCPNMVTFIFSGCYFIAIGLRH